jgi:hypothetical protein
MMIVCTHYWEAGLKVIAWMILSSPLLCMAGASFSGHYCCVSVLVHHSADVNITTSAGGMTVTMMAAAFGH